MKNCKNYLKVCLSGALLALSGILLSTSINAPVYVSNASEIAAPKSATFDFSNEREVNEYYETEHQQERVLSANVLQGTTTETSAAFNISLRTLVSQGLKPGNNDFGLLVDDKTYVGETDRIVNEEHTEFEYVTQSDSSGSGLGVIENKKRSPEERIDPETGEELLEFAVVDSSLILFNPSRPTGKEYNLYVPAYARARNSKEALRYLCRVNVIREGAISKEGSYFENPNPKEGELPVNRWERAPSDKNINIHIPKEITECEYGAFKDVPDNVYFRFEASSIPAGFHENWAIPAEGTEGLKIEFNYGASETDPEKNPFFDSHRVKGIQGSKIDLANPVDIITGYKEDEDKIFVGDKYNQPLIIEYKILKDDQSSTEYLELPIINENTNYDSVGRISTVIYDREINIPINKGEKIDASSFVLHNLYEGFIDQNSGKYTIDPNKPLKIACKKIFDKEVNINELIEYRTDSITKFLDYTNYSFTADLVLDLTSEKYPEPHSLYLDVKENSYKQNLSGIESGKARIRYCLYNLYKTTYIFTYKGANNELKTVHYDVVTPVSYQELNSAKNNKISLLVRDNVIAPDYKPQNLVKLQIENLIIQMDLLTITASKSTAKLAKSEISYRFGNLVIFDKDAKTLPSVFDYNVFTLIFFAIYTVVYAAASVGVYYFLKEKFKNDEFRRINKNKFIKADLIGYGGLLIVLLAVLSIVFRTTGLNNTIVVFNPVDPFVIAFSIVAAIVIGYFIVTLVKMIKTETERQKILRLKLNEDKDEDGTN